MISVPTERVIYLWYDSHLRWMIYASHMEERILYHSCEASISYRIAIYHLLLPLRCFYAIIHKEAVIL